MRIPSTPEEIEEDQRPIGWMLIGLAGFIALCVYFFPGG